MPTPSFDPFDPDVPDGGDDPADYSADNLINLRALRSMAVAGLVPGFVQTRSLGSGPDISRPQYVTWLKASELLGFRLKLVWGGTGSVRPTSCEWEWSNDNGSTWTSMGSAQANTFDSDDNITGTTNSGGVFTLILELWAKVLRALANLAAHTAVTTGAHGTGSIALQDAGAVAVTGGTINGTSVGLTTPGLVRSLRVAEAAVDIPQAADAATVTMDLSAGSDFTLQPSTTTSHTMTIAVSNPPASGQTQGFFFAIINGRRSADAKITWPGSFKWIGGSTARPSDTTLELSGRNLFSATTRDGGTTYDVQHLGKRG